MANCDKTTVALKTTPLASKMQKPVQSIIKSAELKMKEFEEKRRQILKIAKKQDAAKKQKVYYKTCKYCMKVLQPRNMKKHLDVYCRTLRAMWIHCKKNVMIKKTVEKKQ